MVDAPFHYCTLTLLDQVADRFVCYLYVRVYLDAFRR